MIENIEQLKKERPDLVTDFENMTKEQLLNQCYLECIDAINMEERVQTFMNECTINMSKTNYTIGSIKTLIAEKQEQDINEYCFDISDENIDSEILLEVKENADKFRS